MSNLLAYGSQVAERLNIIRGTANSYMSNDTIFEQEIAELEQIYSQVYSREQEFYQKLNISNHSYEGIINRIREIEHKYDCLLPNGAVINEIRRRFDFSSGRTLSNQTLSEELENALNKYLNNEFQNDENQQKFFDILEERHNFTDSILAYLEQSLRNNSGGKMIIYTHRGNIKHKIGLGKIIVSATERKGDVKKQKENAIPLIKVETDQLYKISSELKHKLIEHFETIQRKDNSVFSLTQEQYREEVNFIIRKYVNELNMISHNHYDLTRSIASTIGYLGEIRATLILHQLVPGSGVVATGNLRTAAKGQEIPIDLVCQANGFQIKNYDIPNNLVTFSNSMSATNWIDNRMQLTGTPRDILISLFGIYQYNQPLHTNGNQEIQGLDEYQNTYEQIGPIFDSMSRLYDSRIPYVIKIQDVFSVNGNPIFGNHQLYFNTFFWINNKLIPSSWIIRRLIENLRGSSAIIRTSYSIEAPEKTYLRYQKMRNVHLKKGSIPYTSEQAASMVKVNYSITFNLSEFAHL